MSNIVQIVVAGSKVGLVGLKDTFEQVAAEGLSSHKEIADRLLESVAENNYIAPTVRDAYREALVREYKRFRGEAVPDGGPGDAAGLEIKVIGREGCLRCKNLAEEVLTVLEELDVVADFEHVTDASRVAGLGGVVPPSLIVNGKVIAAGRIPGKPELIRILKEVSP